MALVVHFVPDPSKALAEMARVVRPGGWVATYVWDYSIGGSPSAPLAAAMKALSFDWSPPPGANATLLPALNNLWRSVGFDEIDTRVIRIPVTFADFGEFWGSLNGAGGVGRSGNCGNVVGETGAPASRLAGSARRSCQTGASLTKHAPMPSRDGRRLSRASIRGRGTT